MSILACVDCNKDDLASHADFHSRAGSCERHGRAPDKHCADCRGRRHQKLRQPRCRECNRLMCQRRRRVGKMKALIAELGLPEDTIRNTDGSCRVVVVTGLLHAADPAGFLAALQEISEGLVQIDGEGALLPSSGVVQGHFPPRLMDAPPPGEPGRTFAKLIDLHATAGGLTVVSLPQTAGFVDTGRPVGEGEFVIGVRGRSMLPLIADGAHCVFQEAEFDDSLNGNIVLARGREGLDPDDGGRFTVKRLRVSPRRQIVLLPENEDYEPIVVGRHDDVRILAVYRRVVEVA